MPKLKPHKGLLKRVKITARGKILRHKANKQHLMSSKSSSRRRRLRGAAIIKSTDKKTIRRMLGMG